MSETAYPLNSTKLQARKQSTLQQIQVDVIQVDNTGRQIGTRHITGPLPLLVKSSQYITKSKSMTIQNMYMRCTSRGLYR